MSERQACILVIDDEVHITRVVSLKLRNAGYAVLTAADGEEGYEQAVQHTPDLIITDLQMPYLTGIEMARKLRGHRATSRTPVIMLTARGFGLTQEDIAGTNIIEMISKPFGPSALLDRVNQLLEDTPSRGADAA